MAKILLVAPLPPQLIPNDKIEAAHYRTWQFLQPLIGAGHAICLCGSRKDGGESGLPVPPEWAEQLSIVSIPYGNYGWAKELQSAHDAFGPDCVVAVNFGHCLYATKLRTPNPIWMDIYGDQLTIMQAASYRSRSDRGIETTIAFMSQILQSGDLFSVCSEPQRHLLVGQLAMTGRLNSRTFGFEFVEVVPPGASPSDFRDTTGRIERSMMSGDGVGQDDFVVLWCGGYNAWTDVDSLYKGLQSAMATDPRIRFVSVGASTYQGPDNVYERFKGLVEGSELSSRFHMLGWQPWSRIDAYYRESDVGINIDAYHYETVYGTRTRLLEMMGAGLPVVTSLGSELSYHLMDREAALTFEIGDWQRLSEHLLTLAGVVENARKYVQGELSFHATTAPVRAWVQKPIPAPDKGSQGSTVSLKRVEHRYRSLVRRALWRLFGLDK